MMEVRELMDALGPAASAEQAAALLEHPQTEQAHVLAVLRKRDLPSTVIEAIARDERWNSRHIIKAAIVNHAKTPKTLALRLVNQLFWKELLKVANNFRLPMPIRLTAEKYLRDRLPQLELGERIALARTATARLLPGLIGDGNARVVAALLNNPRLREVQVLQIVEAPRSTPEILRTVADSERWASRPEVRTAVIKNHVLRGEPEGTERERLAHEKDVLGFYLSGHPLERYRADLVALGILSSQDIGSLSEGAEVKLGGVISETRSHTDRNGRPMAFGTIEDPDGAVDLVVFPDAFEKVKAAFVTDAMVVIQGRLSGRNGRQSLRVEKVLSMEDARETLADALNVKLPAEMLVPEPLEQLKAMLEGHRGGCTLYLHLELGDGRTEVIRSRALTVAPSDALISEIGAFLGERRTWVSQKS